MANNGLPADRHVQAGEYCREIESYLCRKNDGQLIRVVGPSFDLVTSWAAAGVPLKVAFNGIDRRVERDSRKGPRRRPVRIEFCEADVLDAFDEWRRAVGLAAADGVSEGAGESGRRGVSLPAHLERVVLRLTAGRARGTLAGSFDAIIDRVAHELDAARAEARGVRGSARHALLDRLAELETELLRAARSTLDEPTQLALAGEADEELEPFLETMPPDALARAREAVINRLVRARFDLPTVAFL
jgi:hypothetical protein